MDLEALSWIGGSVGAVTGIAALIISVYFTRRATKAAEDAAISAGKTTEIEAARHHGELTPQFSCSVAQRGPGSGRAVLTLELDGPAALQGLDEVSVRIRSDQPPTSQLAGGISQPKIDETMWAPYRLAPGIDGSDSLGRAAAVFGLRRGERHRLDLEPTLAPSWIDPVNWASRYEDAPIELEIVCQRAGAEPWTVLVEVDQPLAQFDVAGNKKSSGTRVLTFTNVGNAAADKVEFVDDAGNEPHLEGNSTKLVPPGEVAQQVWISDTLGHKTEWVTLLWTDMRGVRRSLKARLSA